MEEVILTKSTPRNTDIGTVITWDCVRDKKGTYRPRRREYTIGSVSMALVLKLLERIETNEARKKPRSSLDAKQTV